MPASGLRTVNTAGFHHGMSANNNDMNMFMGFPMAHPTGMMDQTFMMNNPQSTGGSSNPGTPFNPTNNPRFPVHQLMNPAPIDPNTPFPNFPQMMIPHHPMLFPFPSPEFQKQQFPPNMINQSTPFLPAQFFPMQPQNILPGPNVNQMNFPQMHHGMMPPFPSMGMGHLPQSLPMMPQIETRRSITPNSQIAMHSSNSPNHSIDGSSALDRISLPTMDHRLSQSGGFFLPPPDVVSMMSMMNSGAPGCMPPLMPTFTPGFGLQRKSNSALCEALLFNSDIPNPEELHNNPGNISSQPTTSLLPGFHQGYTFPPLVSDINGSSNVHSTDIDNITESNVQLDGERSNSNVTLPSRISIDIGKNNSRISNSSLNSEVVNTKDENRASINVASYKHEYDNEWKMSKDPVSSASNSGSMSRLLNNDIYQHQNSEE